MFKSREFNRRKVCSFCADLRLTIDYKDPQALKKFTTEKGKIIHRRVSSTCSKHQRELSKAIHRARELALLPFVVK